MALLCLTCGTGQASDKTADIVPTVRDGTGLDEMLHTSPSTILATCMLFTPFIRHHYEPVSLLSGFEEHPAAQVFATILLEL